MKDSYYCHVHKTHNEADIEKVIWAVIAAIDSSAQSKLVYTNAALADNWLLKLAASALQMRSGLDIFDDLKYSHPLTNAFKQHSLTPITRSGLDFSDDQRHSYASTTALEKFEALFYLLDLIILHDTIVFDPRFAESWSEMGTLRPIKSLMQQSPLSLNRRQYEDIQTLLIHKAPLASGIQRTTNSEKYNRYARGPFSTSSVPQFHKEVICFGASYYLALANLLGIYYWPAPMRAAFLSHQVFQQTPSSFVFVLHRHIQDNIRKIVEEVLLQLGTELPCIQLPSFGSMILAECEDVRSILCTALEIRRTKEATSFREWIRKMDAYFQDGNIKELIAGLRGLFELERSFRSSLGLDPCPTEESSLKITLGLSPSLAFGTSVLNRIRKRWHGRPHHITFLRDYYSSCLKNTNVLRQVRRLFGNT